MLATLLNFFGCAPKNKDEKLNEESLKEFSDGMKAFSNRPIYKKLTIEIIDKTPDSTLLQVVFDNLIEKLPKDYKKEFETVMSWNEPRKTIYMIWQLEAEVNNGGYNQFYFNSSGQYYNYIPTALKVVGAVKFADLTKKANETYSKENKKITEHQDGTMEGFSKSYDDNPLNDFDDKFYELYKEENLHQLQTDYIRKHKIDFVDR